MPATVYLLARSAANDGRRVRRAPAMTARCADETRRVRSSPAMLRKAFRRDKRRAVKALDGVSLEVRARRRSTALVGPDGAGKTTLIRLAAGLMTADAGELTVSASTSPTIRRGPGPHRLHAAAIRAVRGSEVQENLDLYADLHGVTPSERAPALSRS